MIINQNTLSNPKGIIKSAKQFKKKFIPRGQLPKLLLLNLLEIFLTEGKYNEWFKLCEAKICLNDSRKSIISHTNNKFPSKGGLKVEFYIYFSNELAPVLLDVYDSCGKLGTMDVTSRTGIIFAIY